LWYRYLLLAGASRVQLSDKLLTYFRLHEASKTVAENSQFMGDNYKVFYNVLYSLNQPPDLLNFIARNIPSFSSFTPTCYLIQVPRDWLRSFIRHYAWQALLHYNSSRGYGAARTCLGVALRHGQPLNLTVLRQVVKYYIAPTAVLQLVNRKK
jgi:hypothetical protein